MTEFRYLVRELTILEGDALRKLPLQYVWKIGDKYFIAPFDKERAGFVVVDKLTIFSEKIIKSDK